MGFQGLEMGSYSIATVCPVEYAVWRVVGMDQISSIE
jgi:hypothetical protein